MWGDISLIKKALINQPKQSFTQKINESLLNIEKEHFKYIFK